MKFSPGPVENRSLEGAIFAVLYILVPAAPNARRSVHRYGARNLALYLNRLRRNGLDRASIVTTGSDPVTSTRKGVE